MDDGVLDIWCEPRTHGALKQKGLILEGESGKTYPIQKDIPVFIKTEDVVALNLKHQRFYDKIAWWYDWGILFYNIFCKDGVSRRKKLLKNLTIAPGMKVLETSIGTGFNIPLFTSEAEYYGIDISMGMLRICQRKNKKWGYKLNLAQSNAEELPVKDNVFDVVFHVCGINFFNNISKAIQEMIRVAKPGAQIFICDQVLYENLKFYQRWPIVNRFFKKTNPIVPPILLIPKDMKNVKLDYYEHDSMYVITFVKP